MTPAEKLSKVKPWRKPSAKGAKPPAPVWSCRIREHREKLRLSLRDVANGVGLSQTAVHQVEHGSDPMLTSAVALGKFFGVPVETLWTKLA